jgi:DNA-directed RNA polymerase subunit RPC12/RpoP
MMPFSALPSLPSPGRIGAGAPAVLTIADGELWCTVCGSAGTVVDVDSDAGEPQQRCIFCGSRRLILASVCLRAGEYVVRGSEAL